MVLTDKFQNDKLKIVDEIKLVNKKTKDLLKIIKDIKLEDKKLLIGLHQKDVNIQDSAKNLKEVKVMPADSFNVYTLLKYENLVLTKSALEKISKHFI